MEEELLWRLERELRWKRGCFFFRGLVHFSFALLNTHMVQIIRFLKKKKNGCWLPHPKFLFAPGCYRGNGPLSTTVSCFGVSRCTVSNVHACHTLHGRLKEWARCKKCSHFHDAHVWLLPMKIQAWVSDPAVLVSGRNPRSPSRALTLMMSVPIFFSNLDFFFLLPQEDFNILPTVGRWKTCAIITAKYARIKKKSNK